MHGRACQIDVLCYQSFRMADVSHFQLTLDKKRSRGERKIKSVRWRDKVACHTDSYNVNCPFNWSSSWLQSIHAFVQIKQVITDYTNKLTCRKCSDSFARSAFVVNVLYTRHLLINPSYPNTFVTLLHLRELLQYSELGIDIHSIIGPIIHINDFRCD